MSWYYIFEASTRFSKIWALLFMWLFTSMLNIYLYFGLGVSSSKLTAALLTNFALSLTQRRMDEDQCHFLQEIAVAPAVAEVETSFTIQLEAPEIFFPLLFTCGVVYEPINGEFNQI